MITNHCPVMAERIKQKVGYVHTAENLSAIKIVDELLHDAIEKNASDIHIEPAQDCVIIRYRIDGMVHDMSVLSNAVLAGVVDRIKMISDLATDEHHIRQDGHFRLENDDYAIAFSVAVVPVLYGEKIVIRLLHESTRALSLSELGISDVQLRIMYHAVTKKNGLILVAGPTGSAKTATLYAFLKEIHENNRSIGTIEDPIEFHIKGIHQTQIQPKLGITFSSGLQALIRHDLSSIMIGEINDNITASLAINTSLTGHLILSSVHTNNAAGALMRLLDMRIEPSVLASTMSLVVAQRLVRKLCPQCNIKIPISTEMKKNLANIANIDHVEELLQMSLNDVSVYTATGCEDCVGGYKGQIGIYEILEMTPSIQKALSTVRMSHDIEILAREEQGMVSFIEDGLLKAVEGITSLEEIIRVAYE